MKNSAEHLEIAQVFANHRVAFNQICYPWIPLRGQKEKIIRGILPLIKRAASSGRIDILRDKRQKICALVIEDWSSTFYSRKKVCDFLLALTPGDTRAYAWATKAIVGRSKSFSSSTTIHLYEMHAPLLPRLAKIGFAVDTLILIGRPQVALKKLIQRYNPPKDLNHLGLVVRKARATDISAILKIFKLEFTRNPQFGWFCASPDFLAAQKKILKKELLRKHHMNYVITQNGRVVGNFSADIHKKQNSNFCKQAGVGLVFSKEIQGKGIIKTAYRILLEDMIKQKVEVFRGGTSQKAVLSLARVMERRILTYCLRFHPAYFKPSHFKL